MGRIRHVKPGFFTHEKLNDLENSHPHLRPMLVYEGLWCQCDANGVFKWQPRTLKREILPFVEYDMDKSLELLLSENFITRFQFNDLDLGMVPKFKDHQYTSAREERYTNSDRKYLIPGEKIESKEEGTNGNADLVITDQNGDDINLNGIPSKIEAIKEQMYGEIWIEQACVVNGFDKDKFTGFIKTWIANKILTETISYPVKKLKVFVIQDYSKVITSNTNGKSTNKKRNTPYVAP